MTTHANRQMQAAGAGSGPVLQRAGVSRAGVPASADSSASLRQQEAADLVAPRRAAAASRDVPRLVGGHDFSQVPVHAVRETAERGVRDGGGPLPHLEAIRRSFGHHDVLGIRASIGGGAAAAARSIGAAAYALGESIAFERTPDLKIAAHEAAHVVQQRAGVDLPGGVGAAGDRYERHADAIAAQVAAGASAEPLLDRPPGGGHGRRGVQRYAFINEVQVTKPDRSYTAEMKGMVSDATVRNYNDLDEFKKHAGKQTDYLGSLADGRWLRFSPTGTNLLGENHTKVTLEQVVPAVGSKSFIYEPLSSDALPAGSAMRAAYETEAQKRFKTFGIEKEKDKQPFGAESLFAKMGFNMTELIPFFDGRLPVSGLKKADYFGQPAQRYLKIAWGFSKDNKAEVEAKQKAKAAVPPKYETLAKVHKKVEGKLDPFITALVVDGYLGDELEKRANVPLLPLLLEFATVFSEAMVRVAAADASSRLPMGQRAAYAGSSTTSEADKEKLFTDWRNYNFEDNVKAATKRGVRYAGMGQLHLDYLVAAGLGADQHPFEMDGKDIAAFTALTDKLKKAAKKP